MIDERLRTLTDDELDDLTEFVKLLIEIYSDAMREDPKVFTKRVN